LYSGDFKIAEFAVLFTKNILLNLVKKTLWMIVI